MTDPVVRRVEWRYTFHDLLTRRRLARLPLVDADLQEVIGGPAEGSGVVPIVDPEVRGVDPWAATTPRRTLCFAQRIVTVNDRRVAAPHLWAGIVWKRVRSGRSLRLSMATVESYWAHRVVAAGRTFAWADDGDILRTLLADAEQVPYGRLGIDLGADLVGTRSDRTLTTDDRKTVLETATSVATNGGGFDWRIAPGTGPDGRPTLALRMAARFGRPPSDDRAWVSAPDGRPGNELLGYELTEDSTNVPTETTALGGGTGPDRLTSVIVAQADLDAGYPLTQSTVSLSTTGDLITQAAIDRHAQAQHTAARVGEYRVTSFTVSGDRGPTLDSYGLGDAVKLRLRDPLHREPVTYLGRIVGRRILPAQPGRNETVAMTLNPLP